MRVRNRGSNRDSDSGGEGYLASVSDLMAGLVFIFTITLAVFAYRLADTTAKKDKEVKKIQSADDNRMKLLETLKTRLDELGILVEIVRSQGVLRLTEDGISFETAEYRPLREHLSRVGKLSYALAEVLPCYVARRDDITTTTTTKKPEHCYYAASTDAYNCSEILEPGSPRLDTVLIEGHTDRRRVLGGFRFRNNLELSSMRAAEVWRMTAECEPSLQGLKNREDLRIVSVSGYGATRLADPEFPDSATNRRIDLRFLMESPRADELTSAHDSDVRPADEVDARYRH